MSQRVALKRIIVAAILATACPTSDDPVNVVATLVQLNVTPVTANVSPGASEQFASAGVWSDGRTDPPTVVWTATGGSVSTTGLYVAGNVAGAFRVIARHTASGLADTATVTVTVPPPPATVLLSEGFEDDNAAARGWYDNTAFTTTTAEKRPGSGARSLAWTWTAGQILPAFGGTARHAFTATEQVYVSYWVKYSTNWVGSGQSYHPHELNLLTTENDAWVGPSYTRLTAYIEHNYQNGGIPTIGTSDGANIDVTKIGVDLTNVSEVRSTAGCNGNSDGIATDCYALGGGLYNNGKLVRPAGNAPAFLPNPGAGYKADWHHVEVLLRMNTIVAGKAQLDGVVQYWFDGQLLIDRRNFLFRTGAFPNMKWNQLILGPYIGPGSPVGQTTWIDDLSIATAKP